MKVLQIAYHFPPMGGAGVQRALKFAKYLPLHGVQTVVIAGADAHYVHDASLLAELPDTLEVHRVVHSPWLSRLAARRRAAASSASAASAPAPRAGHALRDAVLRQARALRFPDESAPWARRALRRARAVLRAHAARGERFELIFSSAPPASAHALAERLAREFGLPWVADFRDLWTDNPAYAAPAWRRWIDRRTEQRWLAGAAGVVTVTPSWRAQLAARRGAEVAFIPNGYDEEDFASLVLPARAGGTFTLVHTGTFYGPRDPAGLLAGLARYLEGEGSVPGRPALRVRLIGNMGARFASALREFELRHPGVVECLPYMPHRAALAELMAADALLLVVGGGHGPAVAGWLPGKIFEYLRSGKPVLMLGDPQGDAAQIVRQHASAHCVADGDAAAFAAALAQIVRQHGVPAPDAPSLASAPLAFERRELARQLAEYLRRCGDRRRSEGAR